MRALTMLAAVMLFTLACKKSAETTAEPAARADPPPSIQDVEEDPLFLPVANALRAGEHKAASKAWDKAEKQKGGPEWKLEYYLGRISALEEACKDVLEAYANALRVADKLPEADRAPARERLTRDPLLAHDVTMCLDDELAVKALAFLEGRLGRSAVPALTEYVTREGPSADARWDALLLLDRLFANTLPAKPTLLGIIKAKGSCKPRLAALQRLATNADADTLADLRRLRESLEDSAKNKCVIKAMDELPGMGSGK